jgi:CHAT domain-containing protein
MKSSSALLATIFALVMPTSSSAESLISSCSKLAQSLNLEQPLCDGQLPESTKGKIENFAKYESKRLLLASLGTRLRQLGYLKNARAIINAVLQHDANNSAFLLSSANVSQAEYLYSVSDINEIFNPEARYLASTTGLEAAQRAFAEYHQLFGTFNTESEIDAGLNWLRLWTCLKDSVPNLKQLKDSYRPQYIDLTKTISERLKSTNNPEKLEQQIFLLETIINPTSTDPYFSELIRAHTDILLQQLEPSTQPKTLSRVLGIQGLLFRQNKQDAQAIISLSKAHSLALAIDDTELTTDWEIELGSLYLQQGDYTSSQQFFDASFAGINKLREKRLALPTELQYQAQSKYTKFYIQYQDLLFSMPTLDYKKIIAVQEQKKISEIENYLQCGRLQTISLLDLPSNRLPDVMIYLIRRSKSYELLMRRKDNNYYHHSIDANQLNSTLNEVRKYINSDNLNAAPVSILQSIFGQAYNLTLGKVSSWLPRRGTLVWVVDTNLQSIPWDALYTTKNQYLIEQYSVGYSIGALINYPKHKSASKQPYILAGGISQERDNYKALPGVETELKGISEIFSNTKILLDSNFNIEALNKSIKTPNILHFATHGKFSRDPGDTYLLGWDGKISLKKIENLVKQRSQPIDLLFLSACETASGDSRATLGMSGSAIRISARSAIASLWAMDDEAMSLLAVNFYTSLRDGNSKIEALRDAKLRALRSNDWKISRFANIFSVILIGAWD